MFAIEVLPTNALNSENVIQTVANIEAMVQPDDAWNQKTLVELLEQDSIRLLIAYDQAKEESVSHREIVGYCLYQMTFEQAEVLRIGTDPEHQRKGIASQVLNRLHELLQLNQVESLLLEVRADNTAAIALYEQQAFNIIHKRKGYYKMPHKPAVDALIMQHTYI
ncbi:ribosomal-protein-alanine N-acetyltransferase [Psychrobacter sp. 4Dc]|uniref:ribosomal protein S18-alanine N-acetyltransferase n=1 Tax=Psychrobacter TaxID=497 RepID=UPI000CB6768B|nr:MULTISPECIES: ribosomal protein S18-alanine N-acetyltransferase [Psychrobacter]PKH64234.1 ribosomal-protein-alanine N-acetyltransferase [Psychrobacter sp. 4Dc]|tara:strand:- start:24 stop:518 length:495 start_codon:yes stop_codon:yes gene_type:complete